MKKVIAISSISFLIDRITKIIVSSILKTGESIPIIKNFFSITLAKNTGVAFSLLEGKIDIVIIVTLIVLFLIIDMLRKNNIKENEKKYYALMIGGALGNLLDRIIYGYVIDFLDFKIINYNYPIFNIADTCIVIGMFLLLISNMKKGGNQNEINSRTRKNKNR